MPSPRELAALGRNEPAELAGFEPRVGFSKEEVAAFEEGRGVGAVDVNGLSGEGAERLARHASGRARLAAL